MLKLFASLSLLFSLALSAYTPVIMPNGATLEWTWEGNVKAFRLVAEPIQQEFAPGLTVNLWGYNGRSPGPLIEAEEGDRIRIYVTNHLPEPTTVHWHGLILPNGMDGVAGLTQPAIPPGETFLYEFPLVQNGTFLYHPHADEIIQVGMGLMGFLIIHPKKEDVPMDRDYAIMTHEWQIPLGASTPDPMTMNDFNYFTFNGKVWPGCSPLLAKKGERVRIRFGNLSLNNHPIHLHGYEFTVTRRGAKRLPKSAQYEEVTVDVPVGTTRDIELTAAYLGDWALHCHKSHHTANGMVHNLPNMIHAQIPPSAVEKIQKHLPGYHVMGTKGMGGMFTGHLHGNAPPNILPYGSPGPFGMIELSGMFTVFKVREELDGNQDPGWYNQLNTLDTKEEGR